MKLEMQSIFNRVLKAPQHNDPSVVSISTCFSSGFMRWLSRFLGALYLELNSEDLEQCKLSRSDINLEESSGGTSSSSESQNNLNRL